MKTVIAVMIVFFSTIDWTSGSSANSIEMQNVEMQYEQALLEYRGAVLNLASDRAIGRSKDHFIAAQQDQMKRLKDSLMTYGKKKR